jgi:hypothetical protein
MHPRKIIEIVRVVHSKCAAGRRIKDGCSVGPLPLVAYQSFNFGPKWGAGIDASLLQEPEFRIRMQILRLSDPPCDALPFFFFASMGSGLVFDRKRDINCNCAPP